MSHSLCLCNDNLSFNVQPIECSLMAAISPRRMLYGVNNLINS